MSAIELSEVIRNWAIVVGGGAGLALACWRGFSHDRQARAQDRQAEVVQRAHITEVFTSAVALLRDDKLEIRVGAIISLIQIANDYPDFGKLVIDLLQAYTRERSQGVDETDPDIDIQMIVSFLHEHLKGENSNVG